MPKLRLTPEFVSKGLTCPPEKSHVEYCDTEVVGLYVDVRPASPGKGTFALRYKADGKSAHQKLGKTSEMSIAEARKAARELKARIQLGDGPQREAREREAAITYGAFMREHYLPHVRDRKRSWRRDEELFRLRIEARFGHVRLPEIARQQVQIFHSDLLKSGLAPATCDHHIKLIRQSLNLATEWEMLDRNPLRGVKLFNADNKVEHYLDDAQLERLLAVLRTDDNRSVCRIALFLLSTGCRLNEALKATWGQIDPDTRVWRIPASNSKSKKVRSVPLNDSALAVLAEVGTRGRFEHLFVNEQTRARYTTIHKVWGRIRRSAGLPHLRIHDLRHMYASFLVNAGCTLYEVQQILGHSDPKVTQRYAHLTSQSLQKAANFASLAISGASPSSASPESPKPQQEVAPTA